MFSFSYVVQQIVAYRIGNSLPRSTNREAADDLDAFTCNRLPELCYDSEVRVSESTRQVASCGSCGVTIT